MIGYLLLTTFFLETCGINPDLKLVINPPGHILDKGPPILVQRVEDSLNLTCRLINHEKLPNYNISWNWQYSQKNSANRVMMVSLAYNEANLVFKSLKETDSGEYTCKCPELNLFQNVWIKVKPFKRACSEKMFVCSNGHCIGRNFVCDGKEDCKFGTDEDPEYCGPNPCQGKIPCDNGRCIPTSFCCDEVHDPNCTTKHKPKCCQQLVRYIDTTDYVQHPFGDMGFLQTTIYTVIGCAMAFMLIVTILVIAICRVHLKRAVINRCPLNHHHSPGLPLYDLFLDRPTDQSGGLLVTYNINNGVQFVGHPIDPPPYCEIIDTPPREGPPPPYVSREIISEPVENEPSCSTTTQTQTQTIAKATKKRLLSKTSCSLKELSKIPSDPINSYEICNSVPSVSGVVLNQKIKNIKLHEFSDSDTDSSCMENDALLGQIPPPPQVPLQTNGFLKSFIKLDIKNVRRKRPLITQKSFDSSDHHRKELVLNSASFSKILPNVTHSMGDLSPDNTVNYEFSGMTLPLRESHIGVRNEEMQ